MTTTAPDFGLDLSGTDDLDPLMREVTGLEALAQALVRRLDTETGTLLDDEDGDYGYDLTEQLGEGMTPDELAAIPGRVENQFRADERVSDAKVKATLSTIERVDLACRIVPYGAGPFTFTLQITDVAKTILNVQPEANS